MFNKEFLMNIPYVANPNNYENEILKEVIKRFDLDNLKPLDNPVDFKLSETDCLEALKQLDVFYCIKMIYKYELYAYDKLETELCDSIAFAESIVEILVWFLLEKSNTYKSTDLISIDNEKLKLIYTEVHQYLDEIKMKFQCDFFNICYSELCN